MYCPRCGAEIASNAAFCAKCGAPVGVEASATRFQTTPQATQPPGAVAGASTTIERPTLITILAVLQFLGAALWLFAAVLSSIGVLATEEVGRTAVIIVLVVFGALGLLQLVCGIGLWTLRPYGRTLQLVFACVGLLAIPVGTVLGILILLYLSKPGIKALFSGRPATELTTEERAQVAALSQGSPIVIAVVVVLLAVVSVGVLGIVAAIAIPGLVRARQAGNEAAAIGRIRGFVSAEATYAAESGGFYGSPDCLAAPGKCLPNFSGEPFLDATGIEPERSGYRFEFYPGPTADAGAGTTPTSRLAAFAYVAVPTTPGQSGERSFCVDSTLIVCTMRDGAEPVGGVCPSSCQPLR